MEIHNPTFEKPGEYIIREGSAPAIHVPSGRKYQTTISGPFHYAQKNEANISKNAVIEYSYRQGFVKYCDDIHKRNVVEVSGSLVENPIIGEMGINKDKKFSPNALADHLRKYKYFIDTDFSMVVNSLRSLKAKISTNLEEAKDNTGARKHLIEKVVETNLHRTFKVKTPVFMGSEPSTFDVELVIDTSDVDVTICLISDQLYEIMELTALHLIGKELEQFNNLYPYIPQLEVI